MRRHNHNRKEAAIMERRIVRQGDVILIPIEDTPRNTHPINRENGRLVLAHGEVTGHAHAIADNTVELVTPEGGIVTADEAAELYLLVHGSDPVDLVHEEHATIQVPPGRYEVRRMREYAPEAPRRLAD